MQHRSVYLFINLAIASLAYTVMTNLDAILHLFPWYLPLLQNYPGLVGNATAVVIVSGVALLFQSSGAIANIILGKLPFSRLLRRVLAGRNFVEGDWPLVVVYGLESPDPGKLLYQGFLTIEFRNGELYVYGDDWKTDGVHAHCFESVRSSFHADGAWGRRLQYFYRQGPTSEDARMRGYTEVYFFPSHELASRHAGQFRDVEHNDVRFYARRKVYRIGEKRLRSPEAKKKAAKDAWAEFEPQIRAMIAQPTSADWR